MGVNTVPTYHTYNVDADCYMVLSKNATGCITSVNMFVHTSSKMDTYRGKLEQNLSGELVKKYGDLLVSNTVPPDHDQIHAEAGQHAGVPAASTMSGGIHWHWSVEKPSKGRNQTLVVYLNALGLGSASDLSGALG